MKKIRKVVTIAFYKIDKTNNNLSLLLQERWDYSKVGETHAFFGWWIEEAETHIEALFREAKEELNIDMNDFPYVYIWEHIQEQDDKIAHRYIYLIKTDLEEKDFTVFEWSGCEYFSPENAKKLKFPLKPDSLIDFIVRNIEKDNFCEKAIYTLTKYFDEGKVYKKPTLFHSIRVWTFLYQRWYNIDVVLAWFFHDIVEDTNISNEYIIENFWQNVLNLVLANTKDDTLEKEKRNEELIIRCSSYSQDALIVKIADIYDNYLYYKKENNLKEIQRCVLLKDLIKQYKKDSYTDKIFLFLDEIK